MNDAIREAIEAIREAMIALAAMSDEGREHFRTPWSAGVWSYATDGRMALRAFRMTEFGERPENDENAAAFDALMTAPTGPTWHDIPALPAAPGPCPKCHGARRVKCEACDGDGHVEWEFYHGGRTYDMEADCPVCGGETTEGCSRCAGYGVMPESPVEIGTAIFNPAYLRIMATLPGCQIAPVDRWTVAVFRFTGGSGAIMPMRR